jgi:hypothetical protein
MVRRREQRDVAAPQRPQLAAAPVGDRRRLRQQLLDPLAERMGLVAVLAAAGLAGNAQLERRERARLALGSSAM